MPRAALALVLLLAAACGDGPAGGPDPVATAEAPAAVLANSQYPELPVDGLKASWLLDTGDHLTHVLSFVDGLGLDPRAATEALRHFEALRREVALEVPADGVTLTYHVRPRNFPQRYVIIVPDGSPLPQWAGRPEEGRSFAATRPVNLDHAVTLIRLAEKPFAPGAALDTMPRTAQLDAVFMSGTCARTATITTEADVAYRYGANIHNQGEGVICNAESRQLTARQLGLPATAVAEIEAANRVAPAPGAGRAPALALPPFDPSRYERLPRFGAIFTLA
jgi:hypothetical protein